MLQNHGFHPATGQWPVFGHEWAVTLLSKAVSPQPGSEPGSEPGSQTRTGPNHAYLLLGAPQIGKTTLARAFALALLCSNPAARPCHRCRACTLLARNAHPDLWLFQPRTSAAGRDDDAVDRLNGKILKEQAETLVREAALRPVEGPYRIMLIQDAHRANETFQNKVLKTLEEPPPQTILLLTAHDRSSVLPTIASRCQVLELRPLDIPTAEYALRTGWQAPPEQAALLARLSAGRLGWAVEQLQDPERSRQRDTTLHTLWRLMAAGPLDRLEFAESLAGDRNSRQLFGLLAMWISWWRDLLLVQVNCADACSNIDHQAELQRQAQLLDQERVRRYVHTLQRIERYLHHTVNTRLALDVLMLNLPTLA